MIMINISIYTLLGLIFPKVEIKNLQNVLSNKYQLKNWRYYEGLQKHQEDDNYVKFNTMKDLKSSNYDSDVIPGI